MRSTLRLVRTGRNKNLAKCSKNGSHTREKDWLHDESTTQFPLVIKGRHVDIRVNGIMIYLCTYC